MTTWTLQPGPFTYELRVDEAIGDSPEMHRWEWSVECLYHADDRSPVASGVSWRSEDEAYEMARLVVGALETNDQLVARARCHLDARRCSDGRWRYLDKATDRWRHSTEADLVELGRDLDRGVSR